MVPHYFFVHRLDGLTDSFYDEIKSLPLEDNASEQMTSFGNHSGGERRHRKWKVIE